VDFHRRVACGIVAFDSWILNEDRTDENMSYFQATQTIYLIDHGRAFLNGNGKGHLAKHKDGLCVHWDNHVLAQDLKSLTDLPEWIDRINQIPEFYIRDSLLEASQHGLPYSDFDHCFEYLLARRERLLSLFRQYRNDAFPELQDSIIDPLAEPTEPMLDYCHLGI
jgi:hypothetical protein